MKSLRRVLSTIAAFFGRRRSGSVEPMSELYFSYGSNMCPGRLREYEVNPERPGQAAELRGYVLRFNKLSTDGSGKANVMPSEGDVIWGVLYDITNEELARLNDQEKGYTPQRLNIIGPSGEAQARVHVADEPSDDTSLRPYCWYKRFLVQGARVHGLPIEYRAMLEAVDATEDPNRARNARRRAILCGDAPSSGTGGENGRGQER